MVQSFTTCDATLSLRCWRSAYSIWYVDCPTTMCWKPRVVTKGNSKHQVITPSPSSQGLRCINLPYLLPTTLQIVYHNFATLSISSTSSDSFYQKALKEYPRLAAMAASKFIVVMALLLGFAMVSFADDRKCPKQVLTCMDGNFLTCNLFCKCKEDGTNSCKVPSDCAPDVKSIPIEDQCNNYCPCPIPRAAEAFIEPTEPPLGHVVNTPPGTAEATIHSFPPGVTPSAFSSKVSTPAETASSGTATATPPVWPGIGPLDPEPASVAKSRHCSADAATTCMSSRSADPLAHPLPTTLTNNIKMRGEPEGIQSLGLHTHVTLNSTHSSLSQADPMSSLLSQVAHTKSATTLKTVSLPDALPPVATSAKAVSPLLKKRGCPDGGDCCIFNVNTGGCGQSPASQVVVKADGGCYKVPNGIGMYS